MSEKHRLAAIVFTDIVGYTQQMDADEQHTMKLLEKQKEIVFPVVAAYNGQILKEIGDGLLIMFDSAIQAVQCVIEFQQALKNEEFSVRAGIHIGDVIFKEGDVYGSAVNIAARIEPLAKPNGICVSEDVKNQLRNQKDIFIRGIGEKQLKGVSETIKLFEILMEEPGSREVPKVSFWKHMWRRRVPQVIGAYIVVSFLILLFIKWLIQHYALSPYLSQFGLIALVSLIPGIFLVTYLHGRPGTRQIKNIERIALPANLIITALILFFVFRGKDLGAITQSVTLINEDGVKIEREIVKPEFRKNLLAFFFDNPGNDTSLNWLQYGLVDMLEYKLFQDMYIHFVSGHYINTPLVKAGYAEGVNIPLTLKQQLADRYHKNYFLSGSIGFENDQYVVDYVLYTTATGKRIAEGTYENINIFEIIDQLETQLKTDLDLPAKYVEETTDLPITDIFSKSIRAVKYHVLGKKAWSFNNDWQKMLYYQDLALEEDSSFAMAHVYILNACVAGNLRQRMEESFDILLTYLHKLPERIQFEIRQAYYSLYKNDNEKAFSVVEMWRDLYPDDINAHVRMADFYVQKGQFENVIVELKTILELDPERSEYLLRISDNYMRLGDNKDAYEYLDKYAKKYPDNIRTYRRLGAFFRKTGDFQKARESYEKALLIDPSDISAQVRLTGVAFALGEFDKIEKMYKDILRICRSAEDSATVYTSLSTFYLVSGQIEKCIDMKQLGYKTMERYQVPLSINIARAIELGIYCLAGRTEDGLAQIDDIESRLIPPYDQLIALAYISIYTELDNADSIRNAIPALEAIIENMKFDLLLNFVYLAKGRIEEIEGDFESAADYYLKINELEPGSYAVNTRVGRCYRKVGKENKGEDYLKESLKIAPADPEANLELALLYYQKGDEDKAMEHLNISLKAWENADPNYKLAIQAEELNQEILKAGI